MKNRKDYSFTLNGTHKTISIHYNGFYVGFFSIKSNSINIFDNWLPIPLEDLYFILSTIEEIKKEFKK